MALVQAQTLEEDNLSVLVNAVKFAEVEDDTLLVDFIKNPWKRNKEYGAGKEPQSHQDVEFPSALVQE